MDRDASSHPHIDHFWNARPANGAFHHIIRPHHWSSEVIDNLGIQDIARLGENITARWAEVAGWNVIARQKRNRGFELDLVLRRGSFLRIVEVKTRMHPRTAPDINTTGSWLSHRKRSAITRGAHFVLRGLGSEARTINSITCDLVARDILKSDQISLYRWPDAFPLGEEEKKPPVGIT